ncbi:MAG TPA: VOC family protein, partial [Kiloniellaceae bacterium]
LVEADHVATGIFVIERRVGRFDAHLQLFGGLALAYNARDPAAVDAVLVEAEAAGGTILKPAGATAWGGYAGYFADPDGHPWEVAHNPFWTIREDGSVSLESPK